MLNFSTPLSALRANAVALDVVANNIANANTEGYARRTIRFSERAPYSYHGHLVGQGVDVADIRSSASNITEKAINQNTSDAASIAAKLDVASELETIISGPGSLTDRLGKFFNHLSELTATPDDVGAQAVVVQAATALAAEINSVTQSLDELVGSLEQQIQSSLDSIHELSTQLIELDNDIAAAEARGTAPLDLVDRRNSVLRALSQEIDIEMIPTVKSGRGQAPNTFRLANGQVSFSSNPVEIFATPLGDDIAIFRVGAVGPLDLESGRLGGLVEARNEIVQNFRQRIETLTAAVVSAVDGAHATGIGVQGGFTSIVGNRGVENVNAPLQDADGFLPIQPGSLFVTVTNTEDDSRTVHEIAIDPTKSLVHVASEVSAIDHLQAIADFESGQLSMLADPGFTFEFTGGVPTRPTTNNISGSAEVQLDGNYLGDHNQTLEFRFVGSGTIGETPGLSLEVRDQAGTFLGTYDVGQGYSPNSELSIGDGVSVSIQSGTIQDGDTFSSLAVSQADQTGLLVALGINTLFTGQDASDLRLNENIANNPSLLASTKSGDSLDTRNLQALIRLRDQKLLAGGTQSFEVFLANTVASIGAEVSNLTQNQDNMEVVGQALRADWLSEAGVDENEEIVRMLQYQRAFQSAARYVSAIDESLKELFNILR